MLQINNDELFLMISPFWIGLDRAAKLRLLNFLSLFRDLQKPTRFSGGGVVAGFFRADAIQWGGGVVAEFFRYLQEPTLFSSRIFP